MSEHLHFFATSARRFGLALPFDVDRWIDAWASLRKAMVRTVPDEFTRDEWAYLITFLDPDNLRRPFQAFGERRDNLETVDAVLRPRGSIAVWLPNNVSLLGPLTLILLSLTGRPVRLKAGSQTEDLTSAFVMYARAQIADPPLRAYLRDQILLEQFDREDPRNRDMAAAADVRVVFGSDEAVAQIERLPHPVDSVGIAFSDRRSEAWVAANRADDQTLGTLIKVFAIYGQAGCTSPQRVVVLDGNAEDARRIRDRLLGLWALTIPRDPPRHVASDNVMCRQWASSEGWDSALAPRNAAVLSAGAASLPPVTGHMTLAIVPADLRTAVQQLPHNIQTIGHALNQARGHEWIPLLASTRVKRFVPLGRMHHFGPVWDGADFWRQLFEEVEFST